jgi:ATP-binding cassette subfamily F protein 3
VRSLIVLENVGVHLPNRLLFDGINWSLYDGARVALAGRNGCGKSTLLRIMAGQLEPTEGTRIAVGGKRLRLAFLDQTALEEAVSSFHAKSPSTVSAAAFLESKFETASPDEDPLAASWEIRKVLSGLGFTDALMDGPMANLSGGWLLRVFIAGSLLGKPDVLLLDEPTNHLDIASIQWLEDFLRDEFRGSLVLVTHDVELQKRVTNELAVLHGGRLFHRKDQTDYLSFRASLEDEKILLAKQKESLQKKIDTNLAFVERFGAKATLASRAQSKLKAAEVLQAEMRELDERIRQLEGFSFSLKFRFRTDRPGGKFPFHITRAVFGYPGGPKLIDGFDAEVKRGQRIAIMGANGCGKTTLLNLLAGRLTLEAGSIELGHQTELGYFGQHQIEELMLEDTVLDNLRARAPGISTEQLRSWLGAFGFRGDDDINKKAKVLSGGEKARLALLRILTSPVNVVLLDEPTNHLDVETKELLKTAMKTFEGTLIFVSHDREFVEAVADRIWFVTRDRRWIDHLGDWGSFAAKYRNLLHHDAPAPKNSAASAVSPKSTVSTLTFEERKKVKNRLKSLERAVATMEAELEKLSQEKTAAEAGADYAAVVRIDAAIHQKMLDWEKHSLEMEELRGKLGIESVSP